jgi:hypothetical protein
MGRRHAGNRSASEGCPSSAWRNWPRCTGRTWAGLKPLAGMRPSRTCFGWHGRWASRSPRCLRPSASAPSGPVYDKPVSRPQPRWQPCLASGSYLLRDNFRIPDYPGSRLPEHYRESACRLRPERIHLLGVFEINRRKSWSMELNRSVSSRNNA